MIPNLKKFYYPQSLGEAVRLLRSKKGAVILAGGTSLIFSKSQKIRALVDITRLGLSYIRVTQKEMVIGAATTAQKIFDSPQLAQGAWRILRESASQVGSHPIRNSVTLGGNIVQVYPWSDIPPALLVLNATIKVRGRREYLKKAENFFAFHPLRRLRPGEVVKEVIIPRLKGKGSFIKFSKTKTDYALVNVAVYLEKKNGMIKEVKAAVGGISLLPFRLKRLERELLRKKYSNQLIESAVEKIKISPMKDIRASQKYRRELVKILVKRALKDCCALGKALSS